jgi:hypothetical protein
MSGIRTRLARIEKVTTAANRKYEMLIAITVPDDFPDPLPSGYCREGDVRKMDLSNYKTVLIMHIPPSHHEGHGLAATQTQRD